MSQADGGRKRESSSMQATESLHASQLPPYSEESDAMSRVYLGMGVCEVSVVLISVGASLQRYALSRIDPELHWCSCISVRTVSWLGGLTVYFFANVLYTIALVYAPASLCATLMATIVPINAAVSRLILGEVLHLVDVQGGAAITVGISLAAYAAPYTASSYDADALEELVLRPGSLCLLGTLAALIVVLACAVLSHETWGSTSSVLAVAMPFCYPIVIGLLESYVQLAQKGGSSMMALTLGGESQLESPVFVVVMAMWVLSSLLVVWWLRKGLRKLEASRLLPIEYGAFTSSSVLAGLVVYDEAQYVSQEHRVVMACGVTLVIAGCAFVGTRRAVRCQVRWRWTSDEMEREEREATLRESLLCVSSRSDAHHPNGLGVSNGHSAACAAAYDAKGLKVQPRGAKDEPSCGKSAPV